jgi:hypothetical protein
VTKTAIIMPVDPAEAVVGGWRREHTPSGAKGMQAHVTLLAPFTAPDQLVPGRMREVRDALAGVEPFDFQLRETAYLGLPSRRVLYLRPEPAEPFLHLIDALRERFPEHPPYEDPNLKPIPHLTIATTPDVRLLERIEQVILPRLPTAARAAEALIVEYGDHGCRTRTRIAFGESGR